MHTNGDRSVNRDMRGRSGKTGDDGVGSSPVVSADAGALRKQTDPAGTQAPPVDTKSGRPRMKGPSQGKSKRAAYMRDFQRKRRAAQKEG